MVCRNYPVYPLNGVQLKKGDKVLALLDGATRDLAAFGDPAQVKFDRAENWTTALGLGPHRCVGMHLARQELRIVLELMTTLAPPFRLAPSSGGNGTPPATSGAWTVSTWSSSATKVLTAGGGCGSFPS